MLLGLIPFFLLLILNAKIYHQISRQNSFKRDRNYAIILLMITALFLICHSPRLVLNIYETLQFEHVSNCGPPIWAQIFSIFSNGLFPIINSSANLIIYSYAEPKFLRSLLELLKCRRDNSEDPVQHHQTNTEQLDIEMKDVEQSKLLIHDVA